MRVHSLAGVALALFVSLALVGCSESASSAKTMANKEKSATAGTTKHQAMMSGTAKHQTSRVTEQKVMKPVAPIAETTPAAETKQETVPVITLPAKTEAPTEKKTETKAGAAGVETKPATVPANAPPTKTDAPPEKK
ncbi:MAG: hypothetical protein R3C19_08705 [Planctomycetaceae bacterium]